MIGKLIKGKGARGVINYVFAELDQKGEPRPRVAIVGGTFAGRNPRELAAEFGALHKLRPTIGKHVIHECLRLPEGDTEPSDKTWNAIAQMWCVEMGIDDFVAVAHGDGHIHIAASRIKRDGSVVSDQHDYKRSEAAIRKIELAFGLTVVESSHLLNGDAAIDHHKAPTRGQMTYNEITGDIPPAMFVAAVVDDILDRGVTAASFVEQVEAAGIKIHPNIASTGRMNGFAYEVDGVRVTSKAMGRGFTWKNLQERGLSYEPGRDDETLSAAKSRRQAEVSEQLGAESGDRPSGRSGEDLPSIRERHAKGRDGDPVSDGGDPGIEQSAKSELAKNNMGDRSLERDDDIRSNDLDHLVYLAAAEFEVGGRAGDLSDAGRSDQPGGKGLAQLADRLASDLARCGQQVGEFIKAIGADEYQVMTRTPDVEGGKVKRRKWSAAEMLDSKAVGWLRFENANGAGVYIRAIDRRVTLLDDVTPDAIEDLTSKGFAPAVSVETSPANFQAWIRLVPADAPEPAPEVATQAARSLTKSFGGDVGAVGAERFGRLPGFTNRKPKHERGGCSPWVTLKAAAYRVASAGQSLISKIEAAFRMRDKAAADQAARRTAIVDEMAARGETIPTAKAEELFLRGMAYSSAQAGLSPSEIDFRACGFALKHGSTVQQVEDALIKHSPDIEARHPSTADYAQRTVKAASAADWVANYGGPSNG